ncbi:MAG: FecR domain-containing protein [Bacteroidota bacterium]|nr:FecR domain-containing protein [Bacteroidota bacterium]
MEKREKHNDNREDKERTMLDEFLSGQNQSAKKYWKEMDEIVKNSKVDTDKAWNKLYNRFEEDNLIQKKSIFNKPVFRIAASVILIVGLGFAGIYIGTNGFGKNDTNVISAGIKQKNVRVNLPDGSEVVLNRNSSIEYPDRFDSQIRRVKLEGEAFFDVENDASRPFTVDAGKANVTVLGTSFNVNTGNNKVEVFVTEGKVRLSNNKGNQSVTLEQGDVGSILDNTSSKKVNTDPNFLAWKTDILVFEGDSLEKVISDLKRVHNINIEIENEEINNLRVTSVFDNQPPDTIIRIICTTFNLEYYKEGNIYFLDTK